jgi:hypothetical protein
MGVLIVTLPLGMALGLVLAFKHSSMAAKGMGTKVVVGLAAGLGICAPLNAVWEGIGMALHR